MQRERFKKSKLIFRLFYFCAYQFIITLNNLHDIAVRTQDRQIEIIYQITTESVLPIEKQVHNNYTKKL